MQSSMYVSWQSGKTWSKKLGFVFNAFWLLIKEKLVLQDMVEMSRF